MQDESSNFCARWKLRVPLHSLNLTTTRSFGVVHLGPCHAHDYSKPWMQKLPEIIAVLAPEKRAKVFQYQGAAVHAFPHDKSLAD